MSLLMIGDEVPNVLCTSSVGRFRLHDIIDGAWGVIVSVGGAFDAVATTELGALAKLNEEFRARNARILVFLDASDEALGKWVPQVEELEDCRIAVPLVLSDHFDGPVVWLVDIDRRIRFSLRQPSSTGRNFYEVLRTLDTLQLAMFHRVATPANWVYGEDVLVPSHLSARAARTIFPEGLVVEARPWYRTTPQPDTR
ncbi:hypothetical protein CTAYLR_005688 [Chrysophaeum taylorii]|uniref:Thioredoxin domain-containing protein n=1 Tax=Chrysophaeum taylorii TaxID=2483200 RepID=A0AAD7XJB0_9STRA|nr:hypothetical protein CTAYLR_005688 [Chrysophaeum taylorii]